jgi:hypothetical protein
MVERTKKTHHGRFARCLVRKSALTRLQNIAILGHYGWIQKQLIELKDQQTKLYQKMPHRK